MTVKAIVGGNWGDEGKGKMTDLMAKESDFVVRFQGGNNAGHTIVNDYGKFQLHLLPSGVFYNHVTNVLTNGVALNIEAFLEEFNALVDRGVPKPKIKISNRVQVLMPQHIVLDQLEEKRLGKQKFGSTQKGIAPFYADKALKIGIQVADLYNYETLKVKIERNLEKKNILMNVLYGENVFCVKTILDELFHLGKLIEPFVVNTQELLQTAIKNDKNILFEGQLGALRDIDHGIYPMSTSSSPLASFGPVSAGIASRHLTEVMTIIKAYSSCVGNGPFVTEFEDDISQHIRITGNEFGATTNRPRRIGWLDIPATQYGCDLQGTTSITLSLLDVLDSLETIKVCTYYELDGNKTKSFSTNGELTKVKPVYREFKGWQCDITTIRDYDNLPIQAKEYIEFIETEIGYPIEYISVGPSRDAIIKRRK